VSNIMTHFFLILELSHSFGICYWDFDIISMVLLRNNNRGSLRKSIGSFFHEVSHEVGSQFGEMGKEIVKGVTMVPIDLIQTALFGKVKEDDNSWAKDWLKGNEREGKPPISAKEGAHSALNIQELFAKNDAKKQAQAKQALGAALRGQFNASSNPSEENAYDRSMKQLGEREHERGPLELHIPVSGKKQRGSLFAAKKRKSTPQDLNRTEYKASKSQG